MRSAALPNQLAWDALLANADTLNEVRERDRLYGHLPGTMDDALPFFRDLLARHHQAMCEGKAALVASLRKEAGDLAYKPTTMNPAFLPLRMHRGAGWQG